MKKALFIALGLFMAMPPTFAKDLIVYLSRSHNTEAMAKMIQAETGGDLVALELVQPYPENYRATVEQVQRENESGYLPPLKTRMPVMVWAIVLPIYSAIVAIAKSGKRFLLKAAKNATVFCS